VADNLPEWSKLMKQYRLPVVLYQPSEDAESKYMAEVEAVQKALKSQFSEANHFYA
jgi:hypothetical protein